MVVKKKRPIVVMIFPSSESRGTLEGVRGPKRQGSDQVWRPNRTPYSNRFDQTGQKYGVQYKNSKKKIAPIPQIMTAVRRKWWLRAPPALGAVPSRRSYPRPVPAQTALDLDPPVVHFPILKLFRLLNAVDPGTGRKPTSAQARDSGDVVGWTRRSR